MTTIYVAFTSAAETSIQSVFAVEQPDGAYENFGSVDSGDVLYKTWYDALPDWVKLGQVKPDSE